MSLIKCPECGKEVSNQAVMCPNCGFSIEKFIQKEQEEEKKILKRKEKDNFIENYIKTIELPKCPEKPKIMRKEIFNILFIISSTMLFAGILLVIKYDYDEFLLSMGFVIGFISMLIFMIIIYKKSDDTNNQSKYEKLLKEYNNAVENPELYKSRLAEREYLNRETTYATKQLQNQIETAKNELKCPYCRSTNIKKITTSNRAVSTLAVGIASSKIGKQWHCNNCKSDF